MSYNVALRYTEAAGGYAGVITWVTFISKEHFQNWSADQGEPWIHEVVEEGISEERATALARTTPFASRVKAALEDATDPKTGEVSDQILEMKIQMTMLARQMGM